MYRILVAEDSKLIQRDIVRMIKEGIYNAEVETAYDGETALDILKKFRADIVITDIKMPVIDGLTLIQRAKSMYPDIKCVIISGYADFTFTHEAMMLQVDEYIMKPVDEKRFRTLMEKLSGETDRIKKQRAEYIMQQFLQGQPAQTGDSMPERYVLALVRVGIFQQYAGPLSRELLKELAAKVKVTSDMWIVNTRQNSEKILIYEYKNETMDHIVLWNRKILEELEKQYARVNIMCSEKLKNISELEGQYTDLANRLGRRVRLNKNSVYQDVPRAEERREYLRRKGEVDVFRKKAERILKNRDRAAYKKEMSRSVRQWEKEDYPAVVLRKFVIALLDEILLAEVGDSHLAEEPGTLTDRMLNDCLSYDELEKRILEYGDYIAGTDSEKPGVSVEMAQKIIRYMQANVTKNLSLQDIAAAFDISASYLCRLFKVYYSDTPISYYNRIKIEKARQMLVEYPEMRVKDIAEILGFSDQYYFSKVFKQQYGVSPLVYKTQITGGIQ